MDLAKAYEIAVLDGYRTGKDFKEYLKARAIVDNSNGEARKAFYKKFSVAK